MLDGLNKDPDLRQKMTDAGFEMVDIPYSKIPAFVAEHTKDYMATAKRMGLVK
jgi:hypothetical protein